MIRRALRPMLLPGMFLVACGSGDEQLRNELVRCVEERGSVRHQLDECNEKTSAELSLIARNLEGVLAQPAGEIWPNEEAPPPLLTEDGEELPGLPVPVDDPPVTFDQVTALSFAVAEMVSEIREQQDRLEDELRSARWESRAADRLTHEELTALREAAGDIGERMSDVDALAAEVERLEEAAARREKRVERLSLELAETIRIFDSEQVHCKGCGWGFTDKFKRRLLDLHEEVLARLDELHTVEADDG